MHLITGYSGQLASDPSSLSPLPINDSSDYYYYYDCFASKIG